MSEISDRPPGRAVLIDRQPAGVKQNRAMRRAAEKAAKKAKQNDKISSTDKRS